MMFYNRLSPHPKEWNCVTNRNRKVLLQYWKTCLVRVYSLHGTYDLLPKSKSVLTHSEFSITFGNSGYIVGRPIPTLHHYDGSRNVGNFRPHGRSSPWKGYKYKGRKISEMDWTWYGETEENPILKDSPKNGFVQEMAMTNHKDYRNSVQ